MTSVPRKKKTKQTQREKGSCDNKGGDQSDVAASREMPEINGHHRKLSGKERVSLQVFTAAGGWGLVTLLTP